MKKTLRIFVCLIFVGGIVHAGMTYVHENVPHTCHKMKTRSLHGCHHTDDAAELREAEKREKSKKFGSSPCTCPWWCFINGSPDPLMDW